MRNVPDSEVRSQPDTDWGVPMRRLLRLAAVVIPALAVSGCATMNVSSHIQRDLDFARYRTYDWRPADALPTGDPRLDKNPFFQDHVQGAVEKRLAAKGFERSTSGTPDLLVHYHASIAQRIDVNRVDREYGYCYDEDCRARVIEYEAGTLVLDIVDTRTDFRRSAGSAPGGCWLSRRTSAHRLECHPANS